MLEAIFRGCFHSTVGVLHRVRVGLVTSVSKVVAHCVFKAELNLNGQSIFCSSCGSERKSLTSNRNTSSLLTLTKNMEEAISSETSKRANYSRVQEEFTLRTHLLSKQTPVSCIVQICYILGSGNNRDYNYCIFR
jgi:hypothetical protein